jgi:hypothetical protein
MHTYFWWESLLENFHLEDQKGGGMMELREIGCEDGRWIGHIYDCVQ